MEYVSILLVYLSGIISGIIATVVFTIYIGIKGMKKKKDADVDPIFDRMKKVKEITMEQIELQSGASGPQKNALHGKYKNGLIGRIKELEEEKNTILRSIIEDGHDPEISTVDDDGNVSKLKLSEFMAASGIKMDPKVPANQSTESKTKNIGKFTVIKGGKDDGTH